MSKFPARVHVLLARESEFALVIRRGPSKCVCTIAWDRRRDTFELGQWLLGRIYERRCDLSPDGKHFIYFAMNGKWAFGPENPGVPESNWVQTLPGRGWMVTVRLYGPTEDVFKGIWKLGDLKLVE